MVSHMATLQAHSARRTGDLFGSGCGSATATYHRGDSGGSVVSNSSPRNVIVNYREQAPFAVHFESLPIGPEYRSVVTHQLHSGVTLRDLIERKGEGL